IRLPFPAHRQSLGREFMFSRRTFLKVGAAAATAATGQRAAWADPVAFAVAPGDWRTFEVRTVIEIASSDPVQIWAPAAAFDDSLWSRPLDTDWTGNAESVEFVRDPVYAAAMVHLVWRGR